MTHAIITYKYWLKASKNPEVTISTTKIDGSDYPSIMSKFWDRYYSAYFENQIINVECYPNL